MSNSTLFEAVLSNDSQKVIELLKNGSNVNQKGEKRKTALHIAAEKGQIEIVRLLLEHGADPNLADWVGSTALDSASSIGQLEIVKLLIQKDAIYHSPDIDVTPIRGAASQGRLDVIKYFIEDLNVPINDKLDGGSTVLSVAAEGGHVDVVQYLLEKGADAKFIYENGKTIIDFVSGTHKISTGAEKERYNQVMSLLLGKKTSSSKKGNSLSLASDKDKKWWQFWK
jgi:ankyrin repeat protein